MKKEEKKIVLTFSLASFLNDMGSDIVYPLWPVFVTTVIGANFWMLGLIDGIGNALNSISKAISGYLSDKIGKRKVFIWSGYLMGALSRLGYAVSFTWWHLIPFKVLDRAGKLRDAPRDAMVAEVSDKQGRGRNFGILRAMDNLGAVTGIILAMLLVNVLGYRLLFALAAIPSFIGAFLVYFFIKDRGRKASKKLELRMFGKRYKKFLIASSLFSLGYFSYSFLLVYAKSFGFAENTLPVFYLIFTLTTSLFALPMGKLSDKIGRKDMVVFSYSLWLLIIAGLVLFKHVLFLFLAFFLYGLQRASLEPVQRAFVAELSPSSFKATGIGTYQMVVGLLSLPASLIFGYLWDAFGVQLALQFPLVMGMFATIALLFV